MALSLNICTEKYCEVSLGCLRRKSSLSLAAMDMMAARAWPGLSNSGITSTWRAVARPRISL